jgi:aerotaxis receptor
VPLLGANVDYKEESMMAETSSVYCLDKAHNEWTFEEGTYIISETDDKGIITFVNSIFCEIAGYKPDELLGKPHNIVRHSDMPRTAFQMLWDDIQSKGFWSGIVKNMRKDGGFYWVHATVLRKIDSAGNVSYLSVRVVPKRTDVEAAEKLYATLD